MGDRIMKDRIMKDRIMKKNGPHDPVTMFGRDVGILFTCRKVCRAARQLILRVNSMHAAKVLNG